MNTLKLSILPAVLLLTSAASASVAQPQNGSGEEDGYTLVWQDLFDSGQLNPNRWTIEVNGKGGGNNELQYYTDREENVRVGDDGQGNGCLILTARREEYLGKHFTSGRLNTKNLIAFKHGKLEAAIKLPKTANGLWPAFWCMGNDFDEVGWPRCGETDIMEFGHSSGIAIGTQERLFNGASHWGQAWDKTGDYARNCTKSYSLQDGEFHLWTMYWDENEIRMYVDLDIQPIQTPYYTIDISNVDPDDDWCAGNYFHKENFVIFNLAIGGNFPGIWDAAGITALNDENGQEASMYINYLKIYQKGVDSESHSFADPGDEQVTSTPSLSAEGDWDIERRGDSYFAAGASLELFNMAGSTVAVSNGSLKIKGLETGTYILRATRGGVAKSIKVIL